MEEKETISVEIKKPFNTSQSISDLLCWLSGLGIGINLPDYIKDSIKEIQNLNISIKTKMGMK